VNVAFRVDSSYRMGAGHVMRCLALAEALRARGANVLFVSRAYPGNACAAITARGFTLQQLAASADLAEPEGSVAAWEEDAGSTAVALHHYASTEYWDWLVVDHYGLDTRWETKMLSHVRAIAVIDDLANREHCSAVLLDQNLQPTATQRYAQRVPAGCRLLLGPRYALLRSEFKQARRTVKRNPRAGRPQLCISLGGTDPTNATLRVLRAAERADLDGWHIDVIVGAQHRALREIRRIASRLSHCTLHVNPPDVAKIVAGAELAIGGAGVSLWERCCLGVPSLLVAQAHNQEAPAIAADRAGVATYLGGATELSISRWVAVLRAWTRSQRRCQQMGRRAAALVDGAGADHVAEQLMDEDLADAAGHLLAHIAEHRQERARHV